MPTTAAERAERRRRGLTLLEILLALALIVALGAISLPPVLRQLDERAFDAAGTVALEQLLIARAEAQTTGEPVVVLASSRPARIVVRRFPAGRRLLDEGGSRDEREEGGLARLDERDADGLEDEADVIAEGWAERDLPRGVRIDRHPDPALWGGEDEIGFDERAFDVPDRDADRPIRLAVFLPDGSALLTEPAWLFDAGGRLARLTVNAWTGLPDVERFADVPPPEDEAEDEEEEPVDDEPADDRGRDDADGGGDR
jgi:hypothetical protein